MSTGRIVIGVDGSSPSRAALEWAIQRAQRESRPLMLVHVQEPEAGLMGEDFAQAELESGTALLAELALAARGRGVDVDTALVSGPVAWALADAAGVDDILVIGTHKTGFLHGRVLGSRSVQIASIARSWVAVIPDTDARFREGVVAGVDDPHDPAVAVAAAAEADRRGDELSMIHASRRAGARPSPLHGSAALAAVHQAYPRLVVRTRESARPAAEALLDATRDKALLVIGRGPSDGSRTPVASVLHDVLLNLNAPALIVPQVD